MWVEELKSGKYRAVERYTDPMTGKEKKVSITIKKNTKKELKNAEQILRERIEGKLNEDSDFGDFTVHDLCIAYNKYLESFKESTIRQNNLHARVFERELGGDVLLKKINARFIKEKLSGIEKPIMTKNNYLRQWKAILRWGFQNDMISDVSWLDKVQPLKDEISDDIKEKYLEKWEIDELLNAISKSRWFNLTKFLLLSGLRIGEALALDISDLDMKERVIKVYKTCDCNTKTVSFSTKTESSTREVFMQDELYELCKILRKEALKSKLGSGKDYLFQYKGERFVYVSYSIFLRRLHLTKPIHAHMMRHTHVSLLAASGIPFDDIARRIGHKKDSKITKEVYFHVTKQLKEQERTRIKSVSLL